MTTPPWCRENAMLLLLILSFLQSVQEGNEVTCEEGHDLRGHE